MSRLKPTSILMCAVLHLSLASPCAAEEVGKWMRFERAYANTSFEGNPFDLRFEATFTHTATGRTLKQLGFYAGDDTWKIYFMPDRLGEWAFTSTSEDADLDGHKGAFVSVPSGLPGRLVPQGNRWKLEDGAFDAPIIIPSRRFLKRTPTANGVSDFIEWASEVVGARLIGTTLVYFRHGHNEKPYVEGKEGEVFDIAMWDRLNSHYDVLRDAGMGHYIMFYSDDEESPNKWGIGAMSKEERRLFRYALARFSAYPIVIWDTGIDIGETRNNRWIDWFAQWFNDNDPWRHPVGSRSGGGSGGKHPHAGSYWSDGTDTLPAHKAFVKSWRRRSVPTIFTDRWREDAVRGGFDRRRIRRSVWEIGLVGGSAVYVGGDDNEGYLDVDYATDFTAAPDCGYAARFFREEVNDLGKLTPRDDLLVAGEAVLSANAGDEYIAYLPKGGTVSIDLSQVSGVLSVRWYNPRSGRFVVSPAISGGGDRVFAAADGKDWVLQLRKDPKPVASATKNKIPRVPIPSNSK